MEGRTYNIYVKRTSTSCPFVIDEYLNVSSYNINDKTLSIKTGDRTWKYIPFHNIYDFTIKHTNDEG